MALLAALAVLAAACAAGSEEPTTTGPTTTAAPATTTTAPAPTTTTTEHSHGGGVEADQADIVAATLAGAAFQDVSAAEAAGYGSTMEDLGCFENVDLGGMGLHYLNGELLDDQVDITAPEALVYELDASGEIAGLVAHEYIVPVDAWSEAEPPNLFGIDFHQHPVLPLWVLHAWLWKDNPSGMFVDFNPKVRLCPEGVPVFGEE